MKEHDSTLFQSNGLALNEQGEKFVHSLNVKQIKCVEAKLTKVRQDMEAPENKRRSYESIFKGTHKQHVNKSRKKENRRKLNERKKKRTENNVQRVHGICVGNSLGNAP